ncbi:protease pro-enzyme activation domain-containing protein [Actinoplanes sp. NPDC049596]|uniref:S53 family peptidase n=1 Tax=unclassified Actinoplanes TaxID=2626549 RepID=UPI0034434700
MQPPQPSRVAGAVAAAALLGGLLSAPAYAGAARHSLPDPALGWTSGRSPDGPADPALVLHLRVYLTGRAPTAERAAALAVSDPADPAYARYLSPAEFGARFGPTVDQTAAVTSWLTGQGLTVTGTTTHYVAVDATVAQADAVFATTIDAYNDAYSPVGGASVPAGLAGDIATVTGLAGLTFDLKSSAKKTKKTTTKAAAGDVACSHWWGEHVAEIPAAYGHTTAPTTICGYTPQQLRAAYGVGSQDGKGATVAIVMTGHLPSMEADANRFFADQHVPGFASGQYTATATPADCDNQSTLPVEEALDTETVHIFAPAAKVVFVPAACTGDKQQALLDAQTAVVDRHLADVTTDSISVLESDFSAADRAAWELLFVQGALEGIGFDFDSGDGGDDGTGEITFPASDPWATAVGGTSLRIGAGNRILGESAWGDNLDEIDGDTYSQPLPGFSAGGSTGGRSSTFAQPAYQRAAVPPALATAAGAGPARRVIPDVSANAGELWLIGFTGADQVYDENGSAGYDVIGEGGTSGSSPLIAALEADAKQGAGHALGFVNPALYARAGTAALHDVLAVDPADPPIEVGPSGTPTPIYLNTLGEDTSLTAAPGFDNATGLGSTTRFFAGSFRR